VFLQLDQKHKNSIWGRFKIQQYFCFKKKLFQLVVYSLQTSNVSGSKNFDPGRVSHLWFGFGKFPHKMSNFSNFFPLGLLNLFESSQKVPGSKAGGPFIYCGSKVSLGRVGSGHGPSLLQTDLICHDLLEFRLRQKQNQIRSCFLFLTLFFSLFVSGGL